MREAILRWWLGDANQTRQPIDLGCYFSINALMLRHPELLDFLPLDRMFAETDHPFGNRAVGRGRRPGKVDDVERALARLHGLDQDGARKSDMAHLAELVRSAKCGSLLPRPVRVALAAVA